MIGPSSSAIARFTVATSSFRDISGSWTAVTRSPPSSRSGITFDHDEPSAHAPCTRITFEAFVMLILHSNVQQNDEKAYVRASTCQQSGPNWAGDSIP